MFRGLGEKENEKNWKSSNKWTWLFQRIFKLLCIEKKTVDFSEKRNGKRMQRLKGKELKLETNVHSWKGKYCRRK